MCYLQRLICSFPPSLRNVALICCFQCILRKLMKNVGHHHLSRFMTFTTIWSACTPFTIKCPSKRCQNSHLLFFSSNDCFKLAIFVQYIFVKFILYKLPLHSPVAITMQFGHLTTHSTKVCLLRANLLTTHTHEGYIWYHSLLFYISILF